MSTYFVFLYAYSMPFLYRHISMLPMAFQDSVVISMV